jgi:two-component system response regulator QseB
VRALLRRANGRLRRGAVRVGDLWLDPVTRSARLGDAPLALPAKEFGMLYALAVDPERVVPSVELLRDVWGYPAAAATRTVDAHASRLRKKLGPGWVLNVRGVGYRLRELT